MLKKKVLVNDCEMSICF